MSQKIVQKDECWQIEETEHLDSLIIEEGADIQAPEGKYVTLTVNGRGTAISPGTYEGNVVLTVADLLCLEISRFGRTEMCEFHAGIVIKDGKYLPEYSVPAIVQGGEIGDKCAKGITINSRDWDFDGFYITGSGEYTIEDVNMVLVGDGTDDFNGKGAGIAVSGDAKVSVNNAEIHSYGISRGAAFVGGNSEVTFNDCFFTLDSGVWTQAELDSRVAGGKFRMMEPPWGMGITGHGRATNMAGMATANYNRCHVISNSWGVLSIDGGVVTRMNVKDSTLEMTGDTGYGVFSIADNAAFDYEAYGKHGSYDVVDHSVIKGVTYPIIMSLGKAGGAFINGTEVYSRFGALIFRNSGGHLDINSKAMFQTELSTFIVKGANSYITVDDAVLKPGNGVILNLMDNDETGMGGNTFMVPAEGTKDTPVEGRDLTSANPDEDVFVSISNMEVSGDFFNSTTNTFPNLVPDPEDTRPKRRPAGGPGSVPAGGPGGAPGGAPHPTFGKIRGFGSDLQGAKNLDIRFSNAKVTGLVTAATAHYPDGLVRITKKNYKDLSVITCTASEPVNNGVIVSLDKDCSWALPGDCYLTKLTLEEGAEILGAEGKKIALTVDGVPAELKAGVYTGNIKLSVV